MDARWARVRRGANMKDDPITGCLEWTAYGCMALLVLLALSMFGCPAQGSQVTLREPVEETCHILWLDHYYDGNGNLTFSQVIFVDLVLWPDGVREDVAAWRLLKDGQPQIVRDHARGGYYTLFNDGSVMRLVRAPYFRETWSQDQDPEVAARVALPSEKRRELRRVNVPAPPPPPFNIELPPEGP